MPRILKPKPGNSLPETVQLVYHAETMGFHLTTPEGLFGEFLSTYGRYMQRQCWWISEIYWKPVEQLAAQWGFPPCLTNAVKGFQLYTKRLESLAIGDLPKVTETGTKLRGYQLQAVRRMMAGDLLLGDTMGAGKTLSALYAKHLCWYYTRMLVLTPNDDVSHEWREAAIQHLGMADKDILMLTDRRQLDKRGKLMLVPYSRFWRQDFDSYVNENCGQETVLVLDEAHRCSSIHSQQHQAAHALALKAGRVWLLTGTEVRDPSQYYGLYKIVRRMKPDARSSMVAVGTGSKLSSDAWQSYYGQRGGQGWDTKRLETLNFLRRGFALGRTKEQICSELPPLTWINKPVPMHPIQEALYRKMEKEKECEVLTQFGETELNETNFLTVYLRLMQLASHPVLLDETRVADTPKLETLLDIIEGMGSQKAIVWSNWPKTIDYIHSKIQKEFPWLTVAKAHGGVSKTDRNDAKSGLKAGLVDVIVANPCVWGEGVNLQAASVMAYWDYHPSSVRWEQSNNRLHRLGQTKPVTAYKIYHPNSIETRILSWLQEKKRLSTIITRS